MGLRADLPIMGINEYLVTALYDVLQGRHCTCVALNRAAPRRAERPLVDLRTHLVPRWVCKIRKGLALHCFPKHLFEEPKSKAFAKAHQFDPLKGDPHSLERAKADQ